jgi:chromosome segregation ATPase
MTHGWNGRVKWVQVRFLSADVGRKEDLIKELRAKILPLDQAQQVIDAKEEQLNTTKEALKKARTDLERKEQAASSAKARVQSGYTLLLSIAHISCKTWHFG